ncbi:MAG: PEGA domain-containing protein [Candidatus Omnitrophica bacterium]|nr:PEGA domain-containing protein [Candidatus Omnitrophota bacterium]
MRKIVFYLFVAIYLVCCPFTILYALGYLFKPGGGELGVVKTGLISLSTRPPGASVYLGKIRFSEKTPTLVRNLLPGDYPLTVALKNYKPWRETVPLEAGKATVLEKIILLPTRWNVEEILPDSFDQLIPLAGTSLFLVRKGSDTEDIVVYDMKRAGGWPLFPADSPFQGERVLSLATTEESPSLLLQLHSPSGRIFLWVEPREEGPLIEEITDLLPKKPLRIGWDPKNRHLLFPFWRGTLGRLDIHSKTSFPAFVEGVRGVGFSHPWIYLLKEDGQFLRVDDEGKNEEVLLSDPVLSRTLFGENGFFQVKVFSKDLLFFLGERGELVGNRFPYRFVERGVRGLEFDPSLQRLLLWRKDRIGFLDLSKESGDGRLFEQGPRVLWVFERGRNIEQAFWVHEGSHALFRDHDEVYLLEIAAVGTPHLELLLRVKEGSSIAYSEETGRIYYLERWQGRLSSIEILPKENPSSP